MPTPRSVLSAQSVPTRSDSSGITNAILAYFKNMTDCGVLTAERAWSATT